MIVYRIAKSKNTSDISGIGASLYPGRWNKKGSPVLYTGENKEIALLETIVHIPPSISPDLDILTIELPDNSLTILDINDLPKNWAQYPSPTILSEMGQQWIDNDNTIALQVPSSIIHSSKIIILNCNHPRYGEVKILDKKKFYFDSRLIK